MAFLFIAGDVRCRPHAKLWRHRDRLANELNILWLGEIGRTSGCVSFGALKSSRPHPTAGNSPIAEEVSAHG